MSCATGAGMFIGFTVEKDGNCLIEGDTDERVAEVQTIIRTHNDADPEAGLDGVVKVRSAAEWLNEIEVFDSPESGDGCGSLDRKRVGCGRSNPPWEAVVEYNGEYPLEALIGCYGTIRRWNPNGSYREGKGWITGGTTIPSQAPKEETLGRLVFQFEGGRPGNDGFVKFFNDEGTEQFPIPALYDATA